MARSKPSPELARRLQQYAADKAAGRYTIISRPSGKLAIKTLSKEKMQKLLGIVIQDGEIYRYGPPAGLERKHSPDPSGEVAGISAFVVREVCERALDQRNRVGFVQQGAARESAYQEPSVRAEHLRTRTGLEETGYSEILGKEECPLTVARSFFVDSNAEEFPPGYGGGGADDEMEDLVSSVHHESRNRREDFGPSFRTMGTMLENLGWD